MSSEMNRERDWGALWVDAIERLATSWQGRLPRGREYARKGHVTSLKVDSGKILARVQGSRSKPYTVSVDIPVFRLPKWDRVTNHMAKEARYPALLLAGLVPEGVRDIFRKEGAELFPSRNSEIVGQCNCPDKSPCKHIAAVHFAFAEALTQDPFLLFRLRGADREQMRANFRKAWFGSEWEAEVDAEQVEEEQGILAQPLDANSFNRSRVEGFELSFNMVPTTSVGTLLTRLNAPASWSLPIPIQQLLGPVYRESSRAALSVAMGGADAEGLDELWAEVDKAPEPSFFSSGSSSESEAAASPVAVPSAELFLPASIGKKRKERASKAAAPIASLSLEDANVNDGVIIRKGQDAAASRRRRARVSAEEEVVKPSQEVPVTTHSAPFQPPEDIQLPKERRRRGRKKRVPEMQVVHRPSVEPATPPPGAPQPVDTASAAPGVVKRKRSKKVEEAPATTPTVVRRRSTSSERGGAAEEAETRARALLDKGKLKEACGSAVAAWNGRPTMDRLLLMLAGSEADPSAPLLAAKESVTRLQRRSRVSPPELMLLLLTGHYAEASEIAEKAGTNAWRGRRTSGGTDISPAQVFVCFTLAAALNGEAPAHTSLDGLLNILYGVGEGKEFSAMSNPPAPLGAWVDWSIGDRPPGKKDVERMLEVSRSLIECMLNIDRVTDERAAAKWAASYAVAYLESIALSLGEDSCRSAIWDMRRVVGSSKLLTRAVDSAAMDSSVLGTDYWTS